MQPITINRYNDPDAVGYSGTIRPEDGSWVIFIDRDDVPTLWIRQETSDVTDNGDVESVYTPVTAACD